MEDRLPSPIAEFSRKYIACKLFVSSPKVTLVKSSYSYWHAPFTLISDLLCIRTGVVPFMVVRITEHYSLYTVSGLEARLDSCLAAVIQ